MILLQMAESSRVGSYKCEFIDEVSEYLICGLCKHAANGPSITTCCGELFCQACIASALDEKKPCPSCEKPTFSTFLNLKLERKIKNLCVHCTMKDRGCQWTGQLEQLDTHLEVETGDCEYVDIECPEKCGQQIQKRQLANHIANECPERDFVCQYCGFKATYDIVSNKHWPECQNYPVPCPNECNIGAVERNILEDHLNTCPLQVVECAFSYAGCNKKLQRQDMDKHMEQSTQEHLALMAAANVRMSREFEKKLQEQRDEFRGYLEQKLQEQQAELKAQSIEFQTKLKENEQQTRNANQKLEREVYQLQKKYEELQTKQDKQIRAAGTKITDNERQIQEKTTQIEKRVSDCESYHFPSIVMDNFKLEDRGVVQKNSQFLYTHSGGYKFRFVVSEQEVHMSVKLEAHSGLFDDSLQWPAKCTITLQLLNQHRDQDHVTVTKELEWKQPTDGPEPIIFSNKFIAHNDLKWNAEKQTQYLKDGRLCFRIAQVKT